MCQRAAKSRLSQPHMGIVLTGLVMFSSFGTPATAHKGSGQTKNEPRRKRVPAKVLFRAAQEVGIQLSHRLNDDSERKLTANDIRPILRGMGFPVHDLTAFRKKQKQLRQLPWSRTLPPALVRRADHPVVFECSLPERARPDKVRWYVRQEDGGRRNGRLGLNRIEKRDRRKIAGAWRVRYRVTLPSLATLPEGYHQLELRYGNDRWTTSLIVSGFQCYQPGEKMFGLAAQAYGIQSAKNFGTGTHSDGKRLTRLAGRVGAAFVGFEPLGLRAFFWPTNASPYGSSHADLHDVDKIDLRRVAERQDAGDVIDRMATIEFTNAVNQVKRKLKPSGAIDRHRQSRLTRPLMTELYDQFVRVHLRPKTGSPTGLGRAFVRFLEHQTPRFHHAMKLEAAREHFLLQDGPNPRRWKHTCWFKWPRPYDQLDGPEMAALLAQPKLRERAAFFSYLQFWAREGHGEMLDASREAGLRVGIYGDVPVGSDYGGTKVATNPKTYIRDAQAGVPASGRDRNDGDCWGLAVPNPLDYRLNGYGEFIAETRDAMAGHGMVRQDHGMKYGRIYVEPLGGSPERGVYLTNPTEDLMGILALESRRNRCVVVGELAGNVTPEIVEAYERIGAWRYALLYDMRDFDDPDRPFLPPEKCPRKALAAVCDANQPPPHAWWAASEIEAGWNTGLYLVGARGNRKKARQRYEAAKRDRAADRRQLVKMLIETGRLPRGYRLPKQMTPRLSDAIHEHIAQLPCQAVELPLAAMRWPPMDAAPNQGNQANEANFNRPITDLEQLDQGKNPLFERTIKIYQRERAQ